MIWLARLDRLSRKYVKFLGMSDGSFAIFFQSRNTILIHLGKQFIAIAGNRFPFLSASDPFAVPSAKVSGIFGIYSLMR